MGKPLQQQKKLAQMTLQQMIWISFTLTAVFATLLVGLSFYGRFSHKLQQTARAETRSMLEQASNATVTHLRNMMKVSDTLSYSVIKKADVSSDSLLTPFQLLYDANRNHVESIAFFGADGRLIEAAPHLKVRPDLGVPSQPWYAEAIDHSENIHVTHPTVSHLFATTQGYTWVLPMSRAVSYNDNGRVQTGVLLLQLRYSSLEDILKSVSLEQGTYLYLTDAAGEILYHPQQQLLSSGRATENQLVESALPDGNHSLTFGGKRRDVAVKTVGYIGWKLIGVTPHGTITLNSLQNNLFALFLFCFFFTVLVLLNSYLSRRVTQPIRQLEAAVQQLEAGDWNADLRVGGVYEVRHLGRALADMTAHVQRLMEDIVTEHEAKRKSELTALQNQINPHFLYNTLDIIVWMIENEQKKEAVQAVTALARFFRISLSKGNHIIPVADEIAHVQNYLTIQEMRYKNRFSYRFAVDPAVEQLGTVKLILQPMVENAIYHAMEFMDGDGEIVIRAWREGDDLYFSVRDNGCGMPPERVEELLSGKEISSQRGSGVGVRNVIERIGLLFGQAYGVTIESEPDEGTDVRLHLPAIDYQAMREGRGLR